MRKAHTDHALVTNQAHVQRWIRKKVPIMKASSCCVTDTSASKFVNFFLHVEDKHRQQHFVQGGLFLQSFFFRDLITFASSKITSPAFSCCVKFSFLLSISISKCTFHYFYYISLQFYSDFLTTNFSAKLNNFLRLKVSG